MGREHGGFAKTPILAGFAGRLETNRRPAAALASFLWQTLLINTAK
jgi:hypothetical protein